MIEFPLRAVHVIRIRRRAGRDPRDLDIERMPFLHIGRRWFASERLRELLAGAFEFAAR